MPSDLPDGYLEVHAFSVDSDGNLDGATTSDTASAKSRTDRSMPISLIRGTLDDRPHLFAIDKKTGKRVGQVPTRTMGQYGLMTYLHQGKQYVVLPRNGGYTVLALP